MQRDQEIVEEQLIMLVEFCESGAAKGKDDLAGIEYAQSFSC